MTAISLSQQVLKNHPSFAADLYHFIQSPAPDLQVLLNEIVTRPNIQHWEYDQNFMREKKIKEAEVWESVFTIPGSKRIFFYHKVRQIDPDPGAMIKGPDGNLAPVVFSKVNIQELIYDKNEKKFFLERLPQNERDDDDFVDKLADAGEESKYNSARKVQLKN